MYIMCTNVHFQTIITVVHYHCLLSSSQDPSKCLFKGGQATLTLIFSAIFSQMFLCSFERNFPILLQSKVHLGIKIKKLGDTGLRQGGGTSQANTPTTSPSLQTQMRTLRRLTFLGLCLYQQGTHRNSPWSHQTLYQTIRS